MKIKSIESVKSGSSWSTVYQVTFVPTWFERVICKKTETTEKYKDNGSTYVFGGGHVYINQRGYELGYSSHIGKAIDAWRLKW